MAVAVLRHGQMHVRTGKWDMSDKEVLLEQSWTAHHWLKPDLDKVQRLDMNCP